MPCEMHESGQTKMLILWCQSLAEVCISETPFHSGTWQGNEKKAGSYRARPIGCFSLNQGEQRLQIHRVLLPRKQSVHANEHPKFSVRAGHDARDPPKD